jgi:hypothetical protein
MSRRIVRLDGALALLLVTALGALLALQGWKSRIPNFDMLTTIAAAQELVDTGRLPDKGVVTSFGSFAPPGLAYLMLPGLALGDPRLFEYLGSIALYFGTLIGIFSLARRYFGRRCALSAVTVYGLSALGLTAANTLFFQYDTHCFYVWMVYWTARWVERDNPRFLAAALLTWAAGMYVFMEMAPAIFIVPVIWFVYRPAVRIVPLLVSAIVAAAIWFPYLRFEASRGFVDLRSQISQKSLRSVDFNRSWCDTATAPESWSSDATLSQMRRVVLSAESAPTAAHRWVSERLGQIPSDLLVNFRGSLVPRTALVLLALAFIGLTGSFIGALRATSNAETSQNWRRGLNGLAACLVCAAALFNEVFVARFIAFDGDLEPATVWQLRLIQGALLIAAVLFVAARSTIARAIIELRRAPSDATEKPQVVAICLTVPWLVLAVIATSERRFWWLWPLQAIVLAAAVTYVPIRIRARRWVLWVGSLAVMLIVAGNPVLLSRLSSWMEDGWSGKDAPEIAIVDRVAAMIRPGRGRQASIGYEVDIWRFMASTNNIDPRYKVGADLDLLFKYRRGITNMDRCAEGFSINDDYRIVQVATIATSDPIEGRHRITARRDGFVETEPPDGTYQVWIRHCFDAQPCEVQE